MVKYYYYAFSIGSIRNCRAESKAECSKCIFIIATFSTSQAIPFLYSIHVICSRNRTDSPNVLSIFLILASADS